MESNDTTIERPCCRFCDAAISTRQTRCKECGSWLNWKTHLLYPETLWVLVGLTVALIAAVAAGVQAADARSERRATEQLRNEISLVAANITKMAFVVADGSSRWDGFPPQHLEVIKTYQAAMKGFLPADLEKEIASTLSDLDQKIQRGTKPQ